MLSRLILINTLGFLVAVFICSFFHYLMPGSPMVGYVMSVAFLCIQSLLYINNKKFVRLPEGQRESKKRVLVLYTVIVYVAYIIVFNWDFDFEGAYDVESLYKERRAGNLTYHEEPETLSLGEKYVNTFYFGLFASVALSVVMMLAMWVCNFLRFSMISIDGQGRFDIRKLKIAKFIYLTVGGLMLLFVYACEDRSPKGIALSVVEDLVDDGDGDSAIRYFKLSPDQRRFTHAMINDKFIPAALEYKKEHGGIDDIVVVDEDINEDETKATVRVEVTYKDGAKHYNNILLKKIDGKWWVRADGVRGRGFR